ncbi:hypothetical protein GRFL_3409 [Christiangramia flava JLT2011]|uniref:Uncharacterized protein n=1 Tax=Christiangramia flava JLT2011 TaxID=1229726 RepID=A0A1L7IAA8_9FLAO|nr:hypothetical protein GRFL_3409 [Christiangramia flava JLT2011]
MKYTVIILKKEIPEQNAFSDLLGSSQPNIKEPIQSLEFFEIADDPITGLMSLNFIMCIQKQGKRVHRTRSN